MSSPTLSRLLILSLALNLLLGVVLVFSKPTASGLQKTGAATATPGVVVDASRGDSGASHPFIRVVDGDTVTVGFADRTEYVRLIGINAPEPNDPGGPECFADEAVKHLRDLTETGTVVVRFDPAEQTRDTYGRLLAYVELSDGTDVGERMLADGYAREFATLTGSSSYERRDRYVQAEFKAKEAQLGLWSPQVCAVRQ